MAVGTQRLCKRGRVVPAPPGARSRASHEKMIIMLSFAMAFVLITCVVGPCDWVDGWATYMGPVLL